VRVVDDLGKAKMHFVSLEGHQEAMDLSFDDDLIIHPLKVFKLVEPGKEVRGTLDGLQIGGPGGTGGGDNSGEGGASLSTAGGGSSVIENSRHGRKVTMMGGEWRKCKWIGVFIGDFSCIYIP